jgi:LuxR family transcriptional regulator, maltose regulon positive regulatory protein
MEALRESYPPLFGRHARRPRLTRLLDASKAQALLLTAPAGYGKTTLAAEWVQGRDDVVWYRATSGSADVAAFSAGISEIMEALVPNVGDRLRQRLRVADTPERAARPLAEILSEDLAPWPRDALLIIDDYHLVVDSEPVEDFMDWLLMLTPALRVLVTTRSRPRWASARRILYGEVAEIDRGQLAMTTDEAALVLEGRSSEEVQALVEQAEGWPALIGLAALSATHEIPKERVSEALYRYFAEEVLRGVEPEVERFMLMASVPRDIGPTNRAEFIRGAAREALVNRLVHEGLLQAQGDTLRFHPLLRSFLRRQLERDEPDLFAKLVSGGIELARTENRWEEAFELALEAGEEQTSLNILEEATPSLMSSGQTEVLERWLELSGAAAHAHAGAVLARIELLIRQGNLTRALPMARSLLARPPKRDARESRTWYLVGLASHLMSEESDALEAHEHAIASARDERERCDALWGAFMAAWEMRLQSASGYLDELEGLRFSDPASQLRLATGRMASALASGSFSGITATFEPMVAMVDHANDPVIETSFLSRVAETQASRGYFEDALSYADRSLAKAEALHVDFALPFCLVPRCTAEIGLRNFVAARQTIRTLSRVVLQREDPYLDVARQVLQLKLQISNPKHQFREEDVSRHAWDHAHHAIRAEYLALRALRAAAKGSERDANELASEAIQLSGGADSIFIARFASLIGQLKHSSELEGQQGQLIQLVRDCAEAEAFESLVLAARAWGKLVPLLSVDPATESVVRRALIRSKDLELIRASGLGGDSEELENPLTPRERQVLACLSDGLSNAEIAKRLFISESTVKVHVRHVLRKLNVPTRLQAALKAAKGEIGAL